MVAWKQQNYGSMETAEPGIMQAAEPGICMQAAELKHARSACKMDCSSIEYM